MPTSGPPSPEHLVPERVSGNSDAIAALTSRLSASERDVRDLREALRLIEERERLLGQELHHRVRNTLAVIRSVFRRSLETSGLGSEFTQHFEGRLNAIARYRASFNRHEAGVELEDVVRDELLEVRRADGPDLTIAGPSLSLRAKPLELMGLAIHELTTNAIKFGALCHKGKLSIGWTITDTPVPGSLRFEWREQGVATLTPAPRFSGFGRQVIEEALAYELGAISSFEFKPGGIECVIIIPAVSDGSMA